jgi:cytochrome P450
MHVGVIDEREVDINHFNGVGHDQIFMRMHLHAGEFLRENQLQAEIGTFIMAGYETTAHTLSFTIYNIALHPHVQKSIYNELRSTGFLQGSGDTSKELRYEDLKNFRYLGNVLKESMRMFPVVAAVPRYITPVLGAIQCLLPSLN